MYALSQEVLRTDVSGMPLEWIDYRDAVRLHFMGQVAYSFGQTLFSLRGGTNARTGRRTVFEVNAIVATVGHSHNPGHLHHGYLPPLNNETLFRRDGHLCMYCGQKFQSSQLSRDHVTPLSRGGRDVHAELRRVHLPEGPARARRPDGVPARALPALEPAAQAPVPKIGDILLFFWIPLFPRDK